VSVRAQLKETIEKRKQLWSEFQQGFEARLGRASADLEKHKNGEFTPEALAAWKTNWEAAWAEQKQLQEVAAKLNATLETNTDTLVDAFVKIAEDEARVAEAESRLAGIPAASAISLAGRHGIQSLAGDQLLRNQGAMTLDPYSAEGIPQKARVLMNALLRGEAHRESGGERFQDLPQADRDYLRGLEHAELLKQVDPRLERLASPFIDQSGAYFTGTQVLNEFLGKIRPVNTLRSYCRVIQTNQSEVAFPSGTIDLELSPERAGVTNADSVSLRDIFGMSLITPQMHERTVKVPRQLLMDATFDIVGFIGDEVRANEEAREEDLFLNGAGNAEPLGILTAIQRMIDAGYSDIAVNHTGSAAAFKAEDLRSFVYELPRPYRTRSANAPGTVGNAQGARPVWLGSKAWIQYASGLRDASGGAGTGQFMFQIGGLSPSDPDLLLGYPILEFETWPTPGSAGDPICVLGNLFWYWIVDRTDINLQILQEVFHQTNEVGYKFWRRFSGAMVRADAFRMLKYV